MSKWLDMLVHGKDINCRCELEERTAIIQFDGEESECEYRALLDFVNENKEKLKNHIQTINGEEYLRLKE